MVERTYCGLDGKFDCFRRSALKRVGGFDAKNFRTAGEDGDIINRLSKIGQLVPTKAKIIHLHRDDDKFSAKDIIKKQGQYSEAQGVMLRHWVIKTPRQIFNAFFREFLLIGLLIPYVRFLALALILIYSVYYSKIIFAREYRNPRILILPFLNIFLLFVSAFYSIRGIIFGKQRV